MANEDVGAGKTFNLEKIYIKDLSFESPGAPEVFRTGPRGDVLLNIRSVSNDLEAERVEVALTVTVKSEQDGKLIFQVELTHAGIFEIRGFSPEERFTLLGTVCPATIYNYAREVISGVADRGGYPQLLIQPLDFDSMFLNEMRTRQAAARQQAGDAVEAAPSGSGSGAAERS